MSQYRLVMADGEVVVDVEDEDGKIDLNFAPPELLSGLFHAAGIDPDVTAAVVRHLLRRRGDADPEEFDEMEGGVATAESPLAVRRLASVVELRQIPGISQALFERLEPAVTVTSRSDGFDPAVASVLSVRALPGLDPAVVEQLMAGEPIYEIEDFDEAELFILQTRRSFYTIRAQAQTTSGATFARIAVVELRFAPVVPFIVHDWRQAAAAPQILAPGR